MSFPQYTKYKGSGVEWLGKVPKHWDVGVLRRWARMKTGHTPSRQVPEYWEQCTIPWFGLADVWQLREGTRKYLGETKEAISELGLKNSAAELLPAGTVVLSRTASVGYSGIMPVPMATTQDFWNWVCTERLMPEYLLYLLRSMTPEFRRLIMGSTHQTIYQPDAAALRVCLPPLEEQVAIVRFIDDQIGKIDSLIAQQLRLIELLKEKRQAVISRAVANGIHSVTLKDSGVTHLGCVPQHWNVLPLMRLTPDDRQIMYGIVLPGSHVEDGVPIVKGGDVKAHRLNVDTLSRTAREIEAGYVRSRLRGGDIVYSIRGSIGEAAMVPDTLAGANITQDAARVAPGHGIHGPWLLCALQADEVFRQLDEQVTGATIRGINIRSLKRAMIPTPPLSEQKEIAEFVKKESVKVDRLVDEAERAIALLQERRAALISAAVTGKIDVRFLADAEAA